MKFTVFCIENYKAYLCFNDPKLKALYFVENFAANDMNKIGQLYLNEGMLQGKQFISKDWIHMSTSVQSQGDIKFCPYKYGYLWWIIDEEEKSFAAIGDGGNVIYVNPKKDMVVSILSTYMPNAKDRIRLIREYIEPAF